VIRVPKTLATAIRLAPSITDHYRRFRYRVEPQPADGSKLDHKGPPRWEVARADARWDAAKAVAAELEDFRAGDLLVYNSTPL
jgi:hypothetical protein